MPGKRGRSYTISVEARAVSFKQPGKKLFGRSLVWRLLGQVHLVVIYIGVSSLLLLQLCSAVFCWLTVVRQTAKLKSPPNIRYT